MARWLGEEAAAETLMEAIENVMGSGIKTRDLGGKAGTKEVTDAVCREIERSGPSKGKGKVNGAANGTTNGTVNGHSES